MLCHENLLLLTPFWNLYSIYKSELVTESLYQKSDKLLIRLIERYDMNLKAFRIGGKVFKFSSSQVSHLLGLSNKGERLLIHTRQGMSHEFELHYFVGLDQLFLNRIVSTMNSIIESNDTGEIRNTVSLICIHFCTTLMFANSENSIKWYIVNIIGDLNKIRSYNWAWAVPD